MEVVKFQMAIILVLMINHTGIYTKFQSVTLPTRGFRDSDNGESRAVYRDTENFIISQLHHK